MSDGKHGLGQLRHLYAQMLDGGIRQEHMAEAARGLLAPGIAELERLHEAMADARRAALESAIAEVEDHGRPYLGLVHGDIITRLRALLDDGGAK